MTKAPAKKIRPIRFKKNTAIRPRAVGVSGHTKEDREDVWKNYQALLDRSAERNEQLDVSKTDFVKIYKLLRAIVKRDADVGAGLRLMRLERDVEIGAAKKVAQSLADVNAAMSSIDKIGEAILAQMAATGAYRHPASDQKSRIRPGTITKHMHRHAELFENIADGMNAFAQQKARKGPTAKPKISTRCDKLAIIWLDGLGSNIRTNHNGYMQRFYETVLSLCNITYEARRHYMLFDEGRYRNTVLETESIQRYGLRTAAILKELSAALKRVRVSRGEFQV